MCFDQLQVKLQQVVALKQIHIFAFETVGR